MDTTTARHLAEKAAAAAGRLVQRHGRTGGPRQQTMTIAVPVENVLRACRDVDVLATLLGEDGSVHRDEAGRFAFTVADSTTTTTLQAHPNRVVFVGNGDGTDDADDSTELLVVEAWPEPRWGGSEVVLRLTLPTPETVTGALAFTLLYRLRALLQTGEVPTLGDVPSGRSAGNAENTDHEGTR